MRLFDSQFAPDATREERDFYVSTVEEIEAGSIRQSAGGAEKRGY